MMWNHVFELCRTVNPVLGVIALMLLGYRVGPTLFIFGWQTGVARLLWAGYIATTSIGSAVAASTGAQLTVLSLVFTLLHLSVITLMAFWDFGLTPRKRNDE